MKLVRFYLLIVFAVIVVASCAEVTIYVDDIPVDTRHVVALNTAKLG